MVVCQCLKSDGTQCKREASTKSGQNHLYCWQHQNCSKKANMATMVSGPTISRTVPRAVPRATVRAVPRATVRTVPRVLPPPIYEPSGMKVYLKTLTGKTIVIDVEPFDNILSVKQKIYKKEGIPVNEQKIIYAGKQLDDNLSVSDEEIINDSLHLVVKKPINTNRL